MIQIINSINGVNDTYNVNNIYSDNGTGDYTDNDD